MAIPVRPLTGQVRPQVLPNLRGLATTPNPVSQANIVGGTPMVDQGFNRVSPLTPQAQQASGQFANDPEMIMGPGTASPFPATQAQQPLPQYGLTGSEAALQASLGAGVSATEQAQQQALQQLTGGALGGLGLLLSGGQQAQQQLQGAEQALTQGRDTGVMQLQNTLRDLQNQLGQGRQAASSAINAGASALQPFTQTGLQAQQLQAALIGALGPEAQAQAIANFQESPGQAFLREQGQRALLSGAAATGGLQGGRVLEELQRRGIGEAEQAFQNRLTNLSQAINPSLQAAGQIGQLRGQEASALANLFGQGASATGQLGTGIANLLSGTGQNIAQTRMQGSNLFTNLAGQGAQMLGNLGTQQAGITQQAGRDIANQFGTTGQLLSQGRTNAGNQLAQALSGTTTGLSNLAQQQGAGLADLIGSGSVNIANLLTKAATNASALTAQEAALLQALATGQGSQLAGLQGQIGGANAAGIMGQSNALSGLLEQGLGIAALGGGFDKGGIFGGLFRN